MFRNLIIGIIVITIALGTACHKSETPAPSTSDKQQLPIKTERSASSAVVPEEKKKTDPWEVKELTDNIKGTSKIVIHRPADAGASGIAYNPTDFWLHCPKGDTPYIVIHTGAPIYDFTSTDVKYRFDPGSPQEARWHVNEDNNTLWPKDEFLTSALTANGVWIEVKNGERSYRQIHFSLAGLKEKYQQYCSAN
jgi:hypothetical protein